MIFDYCINCKKYNKMPYLNILILYLTVKYIFFLTKSMLLQKIALMEDALGPLGTQKIFMFPIFFCENEINPVKFLYDSCEVLAFQWGPWTYTKFERKTGEMGDQATELHARACWIDCCLGVWILRWLQATLLYN